jgi:ATP-binding cassette subfamily B protein
VRPHGNWTDLLPEEELSRTQAKQVIRRLWGVLGPWRPGIIRAALVVVVQVIALVAGPTLVRYGIDQGIKARDGQALNRAAILYFVLAIAGLVLGRAVTRMVARLGENFLRWLRSHVFRHLMSLSMDFFEKEKTGRLVARMTSDIDALQELVSQGLVLMVQNVLLFVLTTIVIMIISWQLALATLAIVPPVYFASRWFRRVSNEAYLEVRDRISTNMSTLQESLEGIRVVQAFAREGDATSRFHATNEAQYEGNLRTVSISAKYFPAVEFTGVLGTAMIIGLGGVLVHQGRVTLGTVAAFVLYLNNLFEPVQQLSQFYNTVQSAGAALSKLFGLLDTSPSVAERPGAYDLEAEPGDIVVSGVSFAYVDDVVLHDVSMTIHSGERVALVGPTGAGKSTLAKLLARFYDPGEGSITVGGHDLRDITLGSLRTRLCVVPQEGYLFAGTLRENVRIGRPDATDDEVDHALRVLGLYDRFAAFPDGLETEVREGGSRLSAGERQLVSLARAALADPAILVLDEATSNLDPGTEHAVEQALERLMDGRTVVVVAHRLSTAARADRVAVVDDGRLVEYGTHDDLVHGGGRYATLFAAWLAHRP